MVKKIWDYLGVKSEKKFKYKVGKEEYYKLK